MKAITLAVILSGLINYFSISTAMPGTDAATLPVAHQHPTQPFDPDDDEDEHKVRPRKIYKF